VSFGDLRAVEKREWKRQPLPLQDSVFFGRLAGVVMGYNAPSHPT